MTPSSSGIPDFFPPADFSAEEPDFLAPVRAALPGVRAAWVGRIPGLAITGERDEAMRLLRPWHEAAVARLCPAPLGWWRAEQVHGREVALVPGAATITAPDGLPVVPGVDGLVTNTAGVALAIYVADCGAIWLADRRTGAIGLLHSGKRGTELGILERALEIMAREFGTRPQDVTAVLGPCIRPPHYETDFAAEIASQARRAGIAAFSDCGSDTAGDLERFYSYRLEKGRTGRMMALLTKPPSSP